MKSEVSAGAPKLTRAYQPKLRLLVTSDCPHNCPFCHNEGQSKRRHAEMDIDALTPFLPRLRARFSRVTLSGGEPLSAECLPAIVDALDEFDFSITIDTAGADLLDHMESLAKISALHVSVISLDVSDRLSSCNGDVIPKLDALRVVAREIPLLNLTLNVPVVAPDRLLRMLPKYLELAKQLPCTLKFISQLRPRRRDRAADPWVHRWDWLRDALRRQGFVSISATERNTEYMDPFGRKCELSDIACVKVGPEYANGRCFANMDVAIDSNLCLQLCRWQNNGVPLTSLSGDSHAIDDALLSLMDQDATTCPHGSAHLPPTVARAEVFKVHGEWPRLYDGAGPRAAARLGAMVNRGDLSYFGRTGAAARLERGAAAYFGVPYVLSFASGSAALMASYAALDLIDGAEVLVPVTSYPGAVTPLALLGASVVPCDVDAITGNVSPESLREVIGPETRALLVTHLYGRPAPLHEILRIAEEYGVVVIEDASHAAGGSIGGRMLGTLGAVGCISMQANKSLFGGEGGLALTHSPEIYERMVVRTSLRDRVLDSVRAPELRRFWETGLGLKAKLHPFAAVIALEALNALDSVNDRRRQRVDHLRATLEHAPGLTVAPLTIGEERPVYYRPKVVLETSIADARDDIVDRAIRAGLQISRPDNPLLHRTPFGRWLREGRAGARAALWSGSFDGADRYIRRIISLPNFTDDSLELVGLYGAGLRQAAELAMLGRDWQQGVGA